MNLLSKLQAVDSAALVPEHIIHNGERIDFHVKILTAGEVEGITERGMGLGKKKAASINFRSRCISLAIVNERGEAEIPLNQALRLSNALANKLFKVVAVHNDFGQDVDPDAEFSEED